MRRTNQNHSQKHRLPDQANCTYIPPSKPCDEDVEELVLINFLTIKNNLVTKSKLAREMPPTILETGKEPARIEQLTQTSRRDLKSHGITR
ncbi:hypothetical protein V6N13_033760 [Hibiscus sabdariffa]|uniref:Uncharacterized protein n=1 Tax=Hibiscus sabdariffa TaxID=183260 RepID=A0ABR2F9M3_9ROSI